jgi:hypothetical protein
MIAVAVEVLDRQSILEVRREIDRAFSRTPDIDHFCSQSAWVLSADSAIMGGREPFCRRGEHGWMLLARRTWDSGVTSLEALESAWRLASPFALHEGSDAGRFADELVDEWRSAAPFDVLVLSGLAPASRLFGELVRALSPSYGLRTDAIPPTLRFRASLQGGVDGFFSRRSPKMRGALRAAERRAAASGVSFEEAACSSASSRELYERLLALEARSWKGMEGDGLLGASMQAFYRRMLPMLAEDGSLRAQIGRKDGEDVAMLVGALIETEAGRTFRGLQFSFDDRFRSLALGNLAQLAQIRALVDEGALLYDLGSDVEYKRRWGEDAFETLTLVAVPHELRGRGAASRTGESGVLDSPPR